MRVEDIRVRKARLWIRRSKVIELGNFCTDTWQSNCCLLPTTVGSAWVCGTLALDVELCGPSYQTIDWDPNQYPPIIEAELQYTVAHLLVPAERIEYFPCQPLEPCVCP